MGEYFYRDYACGTNPANDLALNVTAQANTSYTVRWKLASLEADRMGNYQLKLWQTGSPSNILALRSELPPGGSWSGQKYYALDEVLTIQEYREILSKNGISNGMETGFQLVLFFQGLGVGIFIGLILAWIQSNATYRK